VNCGDPRIWQTQLQVIPNGDILGEFLGRTPPWTNQLERQFFLTDNRKPMGCVFLTQTELL